jgi:hypothetical protein
LITKLGTKFLLDNTASALMKRFPLKLYRRISEFSVAIDNPETKSIFPKRREYWRNIYRKRKRYIKRLKLKSNEIRTSKNK